MDPSDILFSTPTLNDALPELADVLADDACIRMHEDDWRQFEFVSSAFAEELLTELSAIDAIWKEHGVPIGDGHAFRAVHVRKAIPRPLGIPFAVSDFEAMFGTQAEPIALLGYDEVLADVYAIRLEKLIVYAVISEGKMTALGLEPLDAFALQGDLAERFGAFLIKHDLRLVHWRSRTLFDSPAEAMEYLRGNES
ncbi:MAG: hypothetical protein HQ582_20945 [Planctomycetes bacterium]|nr:hypothetical protein [Planctomycetota bacterium]